MITLYTWKTPNGRKISIMLEELGLPYRVVPVDIGKDEQFKADFLAIAPNNKIPAIVDDDTGEGEITLFESGAILVYLAERTGRLLPSSIKGRASTLSWLNWQMGGLGPMLGQLNFFAVRSKEKAPLAIERFTTECDRLLHVMDRRLGEVPFLAGDDYTIADIAAYPWTVTATTMMAEPLARTLGDVGNIHAWLERVGARSAVAKGMHILE